jgi:Fe2+ transport system protein FeoA
MEQTARSNFRLTVLNPGGRDREQHFRDGAGEITQSHQPTNFHAYAACTRGSFQRETKSTIAAGTPVLLLLRGDFGASERALDALQKKGRFVAVSLKETGLHQIADQLRNPARLERLVRIVNQADACLASTQEAADFYRAMRSDGDQVGFIPTPYPIDDSRWDFSRPIEERSGIFIGTREWDVPSRNHLAALVLARRLNERTGERVTVFDYDGRKGARLLSEIGFDSDKKLRVLNRKLIYSDYLREVAGHKIALQLDTSFVPGQVAGDALLCRVPCVGGNGAIDRLAFPKSCGFARSINDLEEAAARLLTDQEFYGASVTMIIPAALKRLSFEVGARQLQDFFSPAAT